VGTNGGKQFMNVIVQPIIENESNALSGMVLLVFHDVSAPLRTKMTGKPRLDRAQMDALEQELEQARHEAQTIGAEMQKSQEELKSTNEELQSTNEEIQSANEELTTSKEEMQSINEELLTVNQELQTKLNELSRASNDMKNLVEGIDIAILFLDNELCVRRFTGQTSRITQLIPSDAGRPISDIASALLYHDLTDDAQNVLRTLVKVEKQVSLPTGEWFEVRILPYRTLENRIDGVMITFTDITASKRLETNPSTLPKR
jgi:two-component system CheB/CheR fusion protein